MNLFDHLEELRMRILYSGAAILIVTAVAFFFSDPILKLLLLPSGGLQLKAFSLMDGFMIKWQIALYTGIVGAFPVWAYHLYRYVSPGLKDNERQALFSPLIAAFILFILGALFGYYLLWGMIRVLIDLFPSEVQFLPAADDYISFVIFFFAGLRPGVSIANRACHPRPPADRKRQRSSQRKTHCLFRSVRLCRDHYTSLGSHRGATDRDGAAGHLI